MRSIDSSRACHQLTCGELSAAFPAGLCARSRKLAQVDLDLLCCALAEKSIRDLPEDSLMTGPRPAEEGAQKCPTPITDSGTRGIK